MDQLAKRVAELCCLGCNCLQLKKWLNITSGDSDFSADEDDTTESDFGHEDMCNWEQELQDEEKRMAGLIDAGIDAGNTDMVPCGLMALKSETFRAQYINIKELRICVGTWNVGGILPPEDLDIKEWLQMEYPADIYVIGLQEIVPLNASNIFGVEDGRPAQIWNHIIRMTLNKIRPLKKKCKYYSDPSSLSRFQPSKDAHALEDELLHSETDSDEVHPLIDKYSNYNFNEDELSATEYEATVKADESKQQLSSVHKKSLLMSYDKSNKLSSKSQEADTGTLLEPNRKLTKTSSSSERPRLICPEQPLDMVAQSSDRAKQSSPSKSTEGETSDSMKTELDMGIRTNRDKRSCFVRIVSKQMVGIFLTIWVRRSLRKHIQNIKVSTVGVGIMGYIGNKGSVSVSMSIYQTDFCFICSHLTSGDKDEDVLRRNSDVKEIHRRTVFSEDTYLRIPKTIYDHERIIWLGDLNYRINLPYERAQELISKKDWSTLFENDQLALELKKGRVFDGWSEGVINFAPTYKYVFNSDNYTSDESKRRRTPAWCDRILSYGKGLRLLKYQRVELKLSDHRPVTAIFIAEVDVFCQRKIYRALAFANAEIEEHFD